MTRLPRIAVLVSASFLAVAPLQTQAQGLFAPVITVNEKAITGYELEQRMALMQALGAPGNLEKDARDALIEDRLKVEAAQRLGFTISEEQIQAAMEEFAGRANLTMDQFYKVLSDEGVSRETYRDFIVAGATWRELIRARFASRVDVQESEVSRAQAGLKGGTTAGAQILMSEIIIPVPPGREAEAQDLASEISQITSYEDFAAAARRFSASPTRDQGGRINWMPLTNLPPQLRATFMEMEPGDVSEPVPLPNAIAIFQLRGLQEGAVTAVDYSEIDYMTYYIDGGQSVEALTRAAEIKADIDRCDDLYAVNKGQPAELLERHKEAPGAIPSDIALELAKMDNGEISTALTRNGGQTMVFLMLCGRTAKQFADVPRDTIRLNLQNERLGAYADGYLAQLRAEARIVEK
ncbi:peptidylprolyl isomerase [Pseudooceanicola nanhaiensis]|uniref:peptidylprolyl isomerase n=1 Tax=Pseudooceanicola nanhaiensis TaxID=375761 RepID=UPI001CD7F5D5|nr:peptidylprolyl isomerase [Pseudooceanicola nanhaiensis]MCA0920925.1 peptidylprolyl isomerase [Pseudooceanicola nanhaiensis]